MSSARRAESAPGIGDWLETVGPAATRLASALPDAGAQLAGAVGRWQPRREMRRRIRRLQRRLPATVLTATGELAQRVQELTGHNLVDLETLQDMISAAFLSLEVRRAHDRGEWQIDDFGFDDQWAEALLPMARIIYRRYWRVEAEGLENVPIRGGALLVSNHAGVFPWDGAMLKVAVYDEVRGRHLRVLVADWMADSPVVSWLVRRAGQTLGHPDDTHRLLTRGDLVLVFPEGIRGSGKPFRERYRLARFGRGGFVASAARAGVPIVPISVVGSEETYPMLADIPQLAPLLGVPYVPITPTLPWLGPLGMIPLPIKWRIRVHPPVSTDHIRTDPSPDSAQLLEASESIRGTIQQGLIDMLRQRRTIFFG